MLTGVCLSTGGCLLQGVWSRGVPAPGGCLVWAVPAPWGLVQVVPALGGACSGCLVGGCLLRRVPARGSGLGVPAPGGVPALGGVSVPSWSGPRGLVPGGCLLQGVPGGDPPTAAAASGTHPTGMHLVHSKNYICYLLNRDIWCFSE